jgi:hypothetical protein
MKAFITITGLKFHFGSKPFEVGQKVKLVKEPDNEYDSEAIKAELPGLAQVMWRTARTRCWATASAPADCTTKSETVPRPRSSMCWTMQWSAR